MIPVLTKTEQKKRIKFKCTHRHNGIEHPLCYDRANGLIERIGVLDIETEDLNADYGIIFCWALYDLQTKEIYEDAINLEDIKTQSSSRRNKMPTEDKRVIESLIDKIKQYDRIYGHYSQRFDVPFIRTRAVMCKVDFPVFGTCFHTDTWRILKDRFRLSRNSLANAHLKLLGYTRKDYLSLSIKHGCLRGEKWAIDLTKAHCRKDVLDTKDLINKIKMFVRINKTSI